MNKEKIKSFLKTLKLNENNLTTILGGVVILILGLIVINYFKKVPTNQLPGISTENPQTKTIHEVAKGDSLWKIAKKYYDNNDWKKIADANHIANPNKIEVGQKLEIPFDEVSLEELSTSEPVSPSPSPIVTPENNLKPADSITSVTYEVKKGDCLWTIAVRAYGDGYKWSEIARENKLHNPNLIHPGNVFILPR